jgi:hypothetical protein
MDEKPTEERTKVEEFEVDAGDLVDRVKALIDAGNVRRVIVKMPDGRVLFEVPLTAGVAVGGAVVLLAPVLAAMGALAAVAARVKVQVVRSVEQG